MSEYIVSRELVKGKQPFFLKKTDIPLTVKEILHRDEKGRGEIYFEIVYLEKVEEEEGGNK